jgi:hypothetical protein
VIAVVGLAVNLVTLDATMTSIISMTITRMADQQRADATTTSAPPISMLADAMTSVLAIILLPGGSTVEPTDPLMGVGALVIAHWSID